jgi:hypothetical protein
MLTSVARRDTETQSEVVMDAANIFREGELPLLDEILDEAFGLLGEDIVIAHAKDVKSTGEVVAA